jgi:hypothetical protein
MALTKAIISIRDAGGSLTDHVPVLFNPEEYTLSRDNNFAQMAVPGLQAPLLQFVNGNMQTLEMELFLDTYEEHSFGSQVLNRAGDDVRELARKITDRMDIDPKTHAPPVLVFTWATLSFTCVLARATQRFIMFRPDGRPVRARLQVTFNGYTNPDLEAREVKRETADYAQFHEVRQGETLSTIAWRAYGDPGLWRPIALRNGIDDPRTLPIGQRLLVPRLPFRDPESGEVYILP